MSQKLAEHSVPLGIRWHTEESGTTRALKVVVWTTAVMVAVFLLWTLFTTINEVSKARGRIIPIGRTQVIESLEGGIIESLLVREGDVVKAGQVIAKFDPTAAESELRQYLARKASLLLQSERLDAFIAGRQPDFSNWREPYSGLVMEQEHYFRAMNELLERELGIKQEELGQKQSELSAVQLELPAMKLELEVMQEEMTMQQKLTESRSGSKLDLLEAKKAHAAFNREMSQLQGKETKAKAEVELCKQQLEEIRQKQNADAIKERAEVLAQLAEVNEVVVELQAKADRQAFHSPVNGVVKSLPQTSNGAVISPGETIAEIVPIDSGVECEVQISPREIGFVKIGQPVLIKVDAFDFSRYGFIDGTLKQISPTTFLDEKTGMASYRGIVTLSSDHVGRAHEKGRLLPGMTVEADIITGRKTVFQYLLKPIYVAAQTAFQER